MPLEAVLPCQAGWEAVLHQKGRSKVLELRGAAFDGGSSHATILQLPACTEWHILFPELQGA